MPFISELLNRPVLGANGVSVGRVTDLPAATDVAYPPVRALAVRRAHGGDVRLVPWAQVADLKNRTFQLTVDAIDESPSVRLEADGEIWLARDVLDKQIVDVEGAKLVRVNDIQLARVDRQLRVAAVDNTTRGFLRRLGLDGIAALVAHHNSRPELIDWEEIDLVPGRDQDVKLKVPYSHLRRQRPAEIAEIIGQLTPSAGAYALETLDDETAAQALAELAPEHATAVLNAMDEEEAADILEEMDADDAADILGDLDDEFAADLMSRMEAGAATDVKQLLSYAEDTAGGLMNTDFMALSASMTVEEVMEHLRQTAPDERDIYYLYVVDGDGGLVGSLSLRDIVVSPPQRRIEDLMDRDIVSVGVADDEAEVARILIKYNLVAVPVLNENERLIGIVNVDDVLDLVAPRSWQNRPRRMLS
ncbi:MAG TPA: CBS domain-containing protein [Dehalococcoidia bacterium]|nr:CBS domain-containing protein [Dehalococcoidia bacterium]